MSTKAAPSTPLLLRPGTPDDAGDCGQICYEAFATLANGHGFPPDFPTPDAAVGVLSALLAHDGFFSVVAEIDGEIVGSNFLDERSVIAGVGPITVDPTTQNRGVGRDLMLAVLERAKQRKVAGVRLLQAAYHTRSLSLYAKLGFDVREAVATLQGAPILEEVPGYTVRQATEEDLAACNRVCFLVHGHDRNGEVVDAISRGAPRGGEAQVVEHDGRITGYTTGIAFFAHTVGETNEDLKALICAAHGFGGPGFLVPVRNADLFRWCLERGLKVVQVMTLMTLGLYNEPSGAYLPSILY
ncbi:MAG: GNAT family N-acetyltransferase [Gaiellaceae bacterium]